MDIIENLSKNKNLPLIILATFLMMLPRISQAQFAYGCLFDAGGCDYDSGDVPPDEEPTPELILNNPHHRICLPYCSSEQDIIDAFTGWFDNLIDPTTECYGVRLARGEVNDQIGPEILLNSYRNDLYGNNSFVYNIGRDVITGTYPQGIIRLPGTCGGAIQYSVMIEADCANDGTYQGTTGADLLIVVGPAQEINVPEPLSYSTCDDINTIRVAYDSWARTFQYEPIDLGEFIAWGGSCQNVSGCTGTLAYSIFLGGVPINNLCFEEKITCLYNDLNSILTNQRLNCGTVISVSITRSFGGGGCPTVTLTDSSTFTLTPPTINLQFPENMQFPACQPDHQVFQGFKDWQATFGFTGATGSCTYREEFYVDGSNTPITRSAFDDIQFTDFCSDTIQVDYRIYNTGCFDFFTGSDQLVGQVVRTFGLRQPFMIDYDPNYMICSNDPVDLELRLSPLVYSVNRKDLFYITAISPNGLIPGSQNIQADPNTLVTKNAIQSDVWYNQFSTTRTVTYHIVPYIDCDSISGTIVPCTGNEVSIPVMVKPFACPANIEIELRAGQTDTAYQFPADLLCGYGDITFDPPSGTTFGVGTYVVEVLFGDPQINPCDFLIFVRERGIKTWYVNDSVGTPGNGTSWSQAFDNLQDALDTAITNDRIWVADGIYFPSKKYGNSDRNRTYYINKDLKIYGGFEGGEQSLQQRNWSKNVTTLSGRIGATPSQYAYSIMYLDGSGLENVTSDFVLDGFCLTGGRGDGNTTYTENRGGAIFCEANGIGNDCSPTIRNCTFKSNYAKFGGAVHHFANGGTVSPTYIQCLFVNNSGEEGGAIMNIANGSTCSPLFINCGFFSNRAPISGSLMSSLATSATCNPSFQNSILWQNYVFGNEPDEVFNSDATATFSFCIVQNRNGVSAPSWVTDGGNNIYEDPQLVGLFTNNFRLSKNSPGIDAGTPDTAGLTLPLFDLDGQPRVNGTIDIGPYENPFVNCPTSVILDDSYGPVDGIYSAQQSIRLASSLILQSGKNITLNSPTVEFEPDVESVSGAVLTILQDGCGEP